MNLSFSSLELLHACPRKFELEKLCASEAQPENQNIDLITGHAVHAGIQTLLRGKSLEEAVWEAYKKYSIEPRLDIRVANSKKDFCRVVEHIRCFSMRGLGEWRLWEDYVEVGFKVQVNSTYSYRGFIDAILVNDDGEYCALEIKTTGVKEPHPAMWANSFQGMSYARIVDILTKRNNPQQLFLACTFPVVDQFILPFWRSESEKLSWLPSLAMDIQNIEQYKKANHFPMRGGNCYQYFRPCNFLGVCALSREWKEDQQQADPPGKFPFTFTLQQLLET